MLLIAQYVLVYKIPDILNHSKLYKVLASGEEIFSDTGVFSELLQSHHGDIRQVNPTLTQFLGCTQGIFFSPVKTLSDFVFFPQSKFCL